MNKTQRLVKSTEEREFIRSIAVHPTESIVAVGYERQLQTGIPGDRDGLIRLWDIETGEMLTTIAAHQDIVTDLQFSPDGMLLASSSADGTVRLWGVPLDE